MEMYGIDQLGIQASQVHHNLCTARLVKKSLERGKQPCPRQAPFRWKRESIPADLLTINTL